MLELLKQQVFRRLYAAHVIHIVGNEFTFIAVVGLLNDLSGSGLSFAAGTIFRLVPYVVTSILAGPLLENWDKRKVMMIVNLLRAVLVSLFFWVTDASMLWIAFLLLILTNICAAFFTPSMQVAVVSAVAAKQRLAANSLLQSTTSFLIIVCQGIASFLVYYFSYRYNFLFDACCYLLSLLILMGLPRLVGQEGQSAAGFMQRFREGFRYVAVHHSLKRLFYIQMAERIIGASYVLLMFYVLQERGEDLFVFGLLDIPLGLGGVIAGIVASKWTSGLADRKIDRMLGWSIITSGISVWLLFHTAPLFGMMAAALFNSFASFSNQIQAVTRVQKLADPAYLSRVFSIREMLTQGTYSFGCLLIGFGAEKWGSSGVSTMLAVWGIGAGAVWLWSLAIKPDSQAGDAK
ncbi:MFS transporter [Brevibacillus fulvus]|uniref:MFS family permease n=1 Tax=Brevibacillus fulvus TaxID=1125967 RepID=A0A939BPS8_9BACL|nr:MFS transporter [Brevibacillus fulvus]MBM7590820.1 MFS family permease [Brevibacillus fulvus]